MPAISQTSLTCDCHSVSKVCPTLCDSMDLRTPGLPSFTILMGLLRFMSIESVILSNHLILCCPLLLLPSIIPSIRVFSKESALCIRWPKYWSFTFSVSPSNEYSGLISFRVDMFDLLAVQGTLKSLLKHHCLKASILLLKPSLWSNSHILTWLLGKPQFWLYELLLKVMSLFCNTLSLFNFVMADWSVL